MPRSARVAPGGMVFHVLNRSVGRKHLFRTDADFRAFERVMLQAHERFPLRILSYCILSNHWHFVAWPREDGELSQFFRWLAHTHAMRWRVAHRTVGDGHLYQGRFKSFPAQRDEHLLTVLRYVERNALTAGLVRRAEQWHWGSLWTRINGGDAMRSLLTPWPIDEPTDWLRLVNTPMTARELDRLKPSLERGRPFGSDRWTTQITRRLNLEHTVRREGRPSRKGAAPAKRTKDQARQ